MPSNWYACEVPQVVGLQPGALGGKPAEWVPRAAPLHHKCELILIVFLLQGHQTLLVLHLHAAGPL